MAQREDIDWAIKLDNISKTFKLPHEKQSSLKGLFLNSFKTKKYEKQMAVNDVSFEVKKGEFFGVVGRNGSGKSTLLKMIAGVYQPNKGKIKINGSLVPFIELGVGFNPELTGRDNVFLNGALLGFSRKQMQEMYEEIVEFAELEKFMDQKLKNYSSGMQVRLAFSIAIRAQSDILLLDEVLAVGDTIFQQKCFNYFHQLKKQEKTVILVSHDSNALRQYCTNGVLIDEGKIITEGNIEKVLDDYNDIVNNRERQAIEFNKPKLNYNHTGSGKVIIETLSFMSNNKQTTLFTDEDENVSVKLVCRSIDNVESPVYGMVIKDAAGTSLFASNNIWLAQKSKDLKPDQTQIITWHIPNIFNTGIYYVSPAIADKYGKEVFYKVNEMGEFKVRKKTTTSALNNPRHQLEFA